ncbi:MAG: RraA family protein [Elusimicrobiota bacterium]
MEKRDKIIKYGCSGMFSDELDKMGYRDQVISGLRMNNIFGKIYGKARTVKIKTVKTADEKIRVGLGFLEQLNKGEILCVQGSREFAYFGELMSRLSLRRKVGGVVVGGLTRDTLFTNTITELTIFAEGYSPKDIKGRGCVEATDVVIKIGKVSIKPNDLIYGDSDGVVVIPEKAKDELEIRILRCISAEKDIISSINNGDGIDVILKAHKEF